MRLIDAEALWTKLLQVSTEDELQSKDEVVEGIDKALHYVSMAPTIEAKPVVHAHWEIEYDDDDNIKKCYCSNCGVGCEPMNYCGFCGALMDRSISCSHEDDNHIADTGKKGVKIPVISMKDVAKILEELPSVEENPILKAVKEMEK